VDTFNWEVFEGGETVVIEDAHERDGIAAAETPTRSGVVQPLGDHGLFITSSLETRAFDDADVAFIEILATTVTAALDRAEREAALRDRKRRLETETERLEEFAGLVSHDLRNPLSVAEGRLDLARTECDSEHLDAVENAHDRMRALIEDILLPRARGPRSRRWSRSSSRTPPRRAGGPPGRERPRSSWRPTGRSGRTRAG